MRQISITIITAVVAALLAACGGAGATEPAGLRPDGPLDVGTCQMSGTPGYSNYQGTTQVWNPGASAQSLSVYVVNWGSNGILLGQQTYTMNVSIPPHQLETLSAPAPGSATSCQFAGWNP